MSEVELFLLSVALLAISSTASLWLNVVSSRRQLENANRLVDHLMAQCQELHAALLVKDTPPAAGLAKEMARRYNKPSGLSSDWLPAPLKEGSKTYDPTAMESVPGISITHTL